MNKEEIHKCADKLISGYLFCEDTDSDRIESAYYACRIMQSLGLLSKKDMESYCINNKLIGADAILNQDKIHKGPVD